jgi:REP element-mobilizing transposase RayT
MPLWSRGYLPHIEGRGLVQHIVIRTHDALPPDLFERVYATDDERFDTLERALDEGLGACVLAQPDAAQIVMDALVAQQGYALKAWVVMPNHVHALIAPEEGAMLGDIVRRWKGPTARAINALHGTRGAFWARDYFDRYMRDERHYAATVAYIENNPVAAGLCGSAKDWGFGSGYRV